MINPFLDACGATGPVLLSTERPGGPGVETHAFDLPFVLVGRDPRSDLLLTHPDVSDRHAYLQVVDGQVVCIDLGSRIGIYQGGKCQRLGYLERDHPIRIGPYRIRLIGGDNRVAVVPDGSWPPIPLELSHRAVRQTQAELARGLALVGSASDCQIRLIDPSVSNYHCSLVRTPRGVWVVDLQAQGGVRVNNQEVAYAQLHEGDALQIGHSVIRLATPPDPNPKKRWHAVGDDPATNPVGQTPSAGVDSRTEPDPPRPATSEIAIQAPAAALPIIELPAIAVAIANPQVLAEPSTEAIERILAPIVNQVSQLQRQIVEEFQQSRAMIYETFATLHDEQTAFINQELDQLHQLSQELQDLRAQLEEQTQLMSQRLELIPPQASRLGSATSSPSASRAIVVVSTPVGSDGYNHGPNRLSPHIHHGNGNGNGNGHGHGHGNGLSQHAAPPHDSHRGSSGNGTIHDHNEQAHARLCERIVTLKTQQKSRWEKLRSFLPRIVPDDSSHD